MKIWAANDQFGFPFFERISPTSKKQAISSNLYKNQIFCRSIQNKHRTEENPIPLFRKNSLHSSFSRNQFSFVSSQSIFSQQILLCITNHFRAGQGRWNNMGIFSITTCRSFIINIGNIDGLRKEKKVHFDWLIDSIRKKNEGGNTTNTRISRHRGDKDSRTREESTCIEPCTCCVDDERCVFRKFVWEGGENIIIKRWSSDFFREKCLLFLCWFDLLYSLVESKDWMEYRVGWLRRDEIYQFDSIE